MSLYYNSHEPETRLSLSLLPHDNASRCAGADIRVRTDAYAQRQERISYQDASAALTRLKQQPETSWLNEVQERLRQQGAQGQQLRPFLILEAITVLHHAGWATSTAIANGLTDELGARRYWHLRPAES